MKFVPSRFLIALSVCAALFGQQPAAKPIPRTKSGKPDFQGFYNIPYVPNMAAAGANSTPAQTDRNRDTFRADPTAGEASVPYTDRGRDAFRTHDSKDDPTSNCWFPGVPRIMQSPYPAQIIQTDEYFVILFEYMHMFRAIPLDGRPHPAKMEPTFMGDSTGHWEGDTIVVDTTNLKDAPWTWLDTAGHQHSDVLHVVERFTRVAGGVDYEFTVDDPKMYSKPWTVHRLMTPLALTPGLPELLEYNCMENNKDLQHLMSNKPALNQ